MENVNKLIDHTLLKPQSTQEQIIKLCEEAIEHDFASVCVNPGWVKMCAEKLREIKYQIKECSREFERDEIEKLTELMRWYGEKFE